MADIPEEAAAEAAAEAPAAAATKTILESWNISATELTKIILENPSLRGFLFGYVAEFQLRKIWFSDDRTSGVKKHDDHNRKEKNDLAFIYRGHNFSLELKSLQTHTVVETASGNHTAKFQCDASDRRKVTFKDGTTLETTALLVGDFDVLAVNIFGFRQKWDFAFALNRELPHSTWRKYTKAQQAGLLATMMPITWPVAAPYTLDLFSLLDKLCAERAAPARTTGLNKNKKV